MVGMCGDVTSWEDLVGEVVWLLLEKAASFLASPCIEAGLSMGERVACVVVAIPAKTREVLV